jgi:putative Mg2+ transporter-C (MgtC) family protein
MPPVSDLLFLLPPPPEWLADLRLDLLGRLVLAAVLGGLIGIEREISGKPAGLRTNILICVGAALITDVSVSIGEAARAAHGPLAADPGRIAAQIVSGIGFIGAGTILQSRGNVIGLTTAATIWVVAGIGIAVGAAAYVEAVGATVLVFLTLMLLGRLEIALVERLAHSRYEVTMARVSGMVEKVEAAFQDAGLRAKIESVERREEELRVVFDTTGPTSRHREVLGRLLDTDDVHRVSRT